MSKLKDIHYQLFIVLLGALLFLPFLGSVHLFDWDEINFAESAREMIVTGNYLDVQIDFKSFWEKPPLFIWLQVLSMKAFGVNEFAARFPNAMVGILSLLAFFNIGKKIYNTRFGLIWVLVYTGSVLPFFYFKSGIIDPLFNLCIFLSIYQFYLFNNADENNKTKHIILSALFNGLGILTKGPVAFLIFGITVFIYMIIHKQYKEFLKFKVLALYTFVLAFVGGFWFILQILNGNYTVIYDFVIYQIRLFQIEDAGHGGFPGYHFVILFFGVFPASIFAIRSMWFEKSGTDVQQNMKRWMLICFWVVLILFSIVNTKIVHYSSMCYLPMGYLAALTIHRIFENEIKFTLWMKLVLIAIAAVLGFSVALFRYVEKYKQTIIDSGFIKDDFAIGNLQATVNWPVIISIIGITMVIWTAIVLFKNISIKKSIVGLFIGSLLFIEATMILVVPRIEQYSQNAAIEFYKSIKNEDCYVETVGFKSYAKYFYKQKTKAQTAENIDLSWLLSDAPDKTVYIVTKNTIVKYFTETHKNFTLLYEKNGFAFFASEDKTVENDRQ